MIRQDNEDDEPNDSCHTNQADPLRVSLSLGVIHAASGERHDAEEYEQEPDGTSWVFLAGQDESNHK